MQAKCSPKLGVPSATYRTYSINTAGLREYNIQYTIQHFDFISYYLVLLKFH